jgi:hypothetical protein
MNSLRFLVDTGLSGLALCLFGGDPPRIVVSFDVGEQVALGALPVKAMGERTVIRSNGYCR